MPIVDLDDSFDIVEDSNDLSHRNSGNDLVYALTVPKVRLNKGQEMFS